MLVVVLVLIIFSLFLLWIIRDLNRTEEDNYNISQLPWYNRITIKMPGAVILVLALIIILMLKYL